MKFGWRINFYLLFFYLEKKKKNPLIPFYVTWGFLAHFCIKSNMNFVEQMWDNSARQFRTGGT